MADDDSVSGPVEAVALTPTFGAEIDGENDKIYGLNIGAGALTKTGTALAVTIANPTMVALNETDIAIYDTSTKLLRTFRWNGATWTQVGTGLSISITGGNPDLVALNGTNVVLADNIGNMFMTFSWNGSSWAQVGTNKAMPTVNADDKYSIAALDGQTITWVNHGRYATGPKELRTYRSGCQ